jgi:O-antigen ligase
MPGSSLVTLADMVFVGVLVAYLSFNKWSDFSRDLSIPDFAFVALLLWSAVSIILSPVVTDFNGIVRESFLILLFLFFRLWALEDREIIYLLNGYILGCVATVSAGLLGVVLLAFFDIVNPWAYELEGYPHLNGWARAQGLSLHPNMFANFLVVGLMLSFLRVYSDRLNSLVLWAIRLLLIFGCMLALSRSALAIFFSLLMALCMFVPSVILRRWALALVFIVGFLFVFASANFAIQVSQIDRSIEGLMVDSMVGHGASIFSHSLGGNLRVDFYRSVYFELKITALELFYRFPLYGIGDGNFYGYLTENQYRLAYPIFFPPYNPHSTYFGLLSETGIVGFFIFVAFVISIIVFFLRDNRTSMIYERLFWIAIIYLFYEGLNTDQLNFRHYIVLLAIYLRFTCRPRAR